MKQLSIGTKVLTIENVYPYRYDFGKGKEVLRVEVLGTDHDFTELLVLQNCTKDIVYLEDGVMKNIYSSYSIDFNCQYSDNKYSIEMTRKSEEVQRLESVEKAIGTLNPVLETLITSNLEVI